MIFVYESEGRSVDEYFEQEFKFGLMSGHTCFPDTLVTCHGEAIFRGWMKSLSEYVRFYEKMKRKGIVLINNPVEYASAHYVGEWYKLIEPYSFKTFEFTTIKEGLEFFKRNENGERLTYYIKGAVRGCPRQVTSQDGFLRAVEYCETYNVEQGNFYARQFVPLQYKEQRIFVYKGTPYSMGKEIPNVVYKAIPLIDSNFYTIDVDYDSEGNEIIVELGDGQVSGLKEWSQHDFFAIFNN